MLTKFNDQYPNSPCGVKESDLQLFNETENKSLNKYFKEQQNLRMIMRDKNKVFGMFT